jgi:hypothetical protein
VLEVLAYIIIIYICTINKVVCLAVSVSYLLFNYQFSAVTV